MGKKRHRLGQPWQPLCYWQRDMLFKAGLLNRASCAAHISFLVGILAALEPSSAFGASRVTLAWDRSTSTNIAGYNVHYGTTSHAYTNAVDAGVSTNVTVSGLISSTTYYFAATAYGTANLESDFSNELSYTNVVLAPPAIALTSSANNATFTAPPTIGLAASVTAKGHSITIVQFYSGATLLGEDTTAPYAFTWSGVAAGSYSLTAQSVYDAGSTVNFPLGERDCQPRACGHDKCPGNSTNSRKPLKTQDFSKMPAGHRLCENRCRDVIREVLPLYRHGSDGGLMPIPA